MVIREGKAKEIASLPAAPTIPPPIAPAMHAASIGVLYGTLIPKRTGSVVPRSAVIDPDIPTDFNFLFFVMMLTAAATPA